MAQMGEQLHEVGSVITRAPSFDSPCTARMVTSMTGGVRSRLKLGRKRDTSPQYER